MFTGLVEQLATIAAVDEKPPGRTFAIGMRDVEDAELGESIAINGCCLTVVKIDPDRSLLSFEAGPETLSRTNLGKLASGSRVNVERSLRVGDRLGGHYVSGHVDAVGTLDARQDDRDWSTLWFKVPGSLTRQMVSKGSITVDGVSLTLVDVEPERFSVALIPHTLSATTLGQLAPGDVVNIETDILAKYVQKAAGVA